MYDPKPRPSRDLIFKCMSSEIGTDWITSQFGQFINVKKVRKPKRMNLAERFDLDS